MKPFLFVLNVVPSQFNKQCEDIAGAKAHIWIISDDKDKAKARAESYVIGALWNVINFEHELEIFPEHLQKLHEAEAHLYKMALQQGIAADFLAYPKVPGNPTDSVKIRRL
ncbi:hypothetical protein [Paenibacillus sp. 2TAB19]|uniref:hypothetical protein n=1 Tax=Paenibacillus sp. 2TAB19 TaxID=3233003 RepID=UPI003F9545E4